MWKRARSWWHVRGPIPKKDWRDFWRSDWLDEMGFFWSGGVGVVGSCGVACLDDVAFWEVHAEDEDLWD